ncbi:ABC transporter ATP-binding protein [Streptomyces atratus]|uniref:ABC transporter ATP-binding protein n=1 Tax=Streptomyces atratus TaxID=1893 RepID=UPI00167123FC|nr:ATP-binding cassette domain-containing protein [Streptomyces atratus]GGT55977.1 ABC transporter ATP-binding protein [Streptomyces atratus]
MNNPAIEARGLKKVFTPAIRQPGFKGTVRSLIAPEHAEIVAVADVSFTVAEGELIALLGPNGAGKSTTIKILSGILTPTAGEVRIAGRIPYQDRIANAHNIGAVFGQRTQLWWDLPARESFAVLRDIFKTSLADHARRLDELDGLLELSSFWDRSPRHMSLGQRVRADLAAALLHDPPIVFLDEPTIGMDAVVKEQVREFLRFQVAERGRTIVLTTHDMSEVSRLAERVVLINHGRVVYDGGLVELQQDYGSGWQIRVVVDDDAALRDVPGFLAKEGAALVFGGDDPGEQRRLVRLLTELDVVRNLEVRSDDLEDIMATVYQRRAVPVAR